jgi:bifunctional non-homologous end joining protein LigD
VTISNAGKVLWPEAGFTKGDMVAYYDAVAPVLLPYLEGRPVTMRRFPDGVDAIGWYQYECRGAPDWLHTVDVPYRDGTRRRFCVVDDVASLRWVVNLGTIELHPLLFRVDAPDNASYVVFDLDPGPPADVVDCARVALRLRDELDRHTLAAAVKTSGSLGLHVYVPLNGATGFDEAKAFARAVARKLAREEPHAVVDRNARAVRAGKVLVDWLQNDPARSTVAPYSLRALPWPTASAPVLWDEVERAAETASPEVLTFTAPMVLERVDAYGDLFRGVLEGHHDLPPH